MGSWKLFHIDLNDQRFGRYDQDFRFGMVDIKSAFFLVKFLEDVKYDGARHFDAHAFRTEDYEGVKDFGRGCMRTYLILKEKAEQWNNDKEIQALISEINSDKKVRLLCLVLIAGKTWRSFAQPSLIALRLRNVV